MTFVFLSLFSCPFSFKKIGLSIKACLLEAKVFVLSCIFGMERNRICAMMGYILKDLHLKCKFKFERCQNILFDQKPGFGLFKRTTAIKQVYTWSGGMLSLSIMTYWPIRFLINFEFGLSSVCSGSGALQRDWTAATQAQISPQHSGLQICNILQQTSWHLSQKL